MTEEVAAAPAPVGGVPVDIEDPAIDTAVSIRFDGQRLRQTTTDGIDTPFRDRAAEQRAWADLTRAAQVERLREISSHRVPDEGALAIDPNPPMFRAAVDAFLEPSRESFSFDALHQTYLAVEFFLGWVSVVDAHRRVEGQRVYVSGCGMAGTVVAYHAFGAKSVVGTEIDDATVALGNHRTAGLPGVGVRHIDPAEPLPFEDGSFDIVESLDVIEHVTDIEAYTRELGRVLAPGGVAIIGAPNRMFPVEQHTGVGFVPWLPLPVGNALASWGARSPWADNERRDRRAGVAEVRTGNVSWLTVIRMAQIMGTTAQRLHRSGHPGWSMGADPGWVEWLARQRKIGVLAPTRQVVGLLAKPPFAASS